jgi:hypothetical protein
VPAWGSFAAQEPELAAFVKERLLAAPAYLATVRKSGAPRVHPVVPVFTADGMFVFMESTSPKAPDLDERRHYALHNGVPDSRGTGGEVWVKGEGVRVTDPAVRAAAAESATYDVADRYILFQLEVDEVRCNGYGDVELPATQRWSAP